MSIFTHITLYLDRPRTRELPWPFKLLAPPCPVLNVRTAAWYKDWGTNGYPHRHLRQWGWVDRGDDGGTDPRTVQDIGERVRSALDSDLAQVTYSYATNFTMLAVKPGPAFAGALS